MYIKIARVRKVTKPCRANGSDAFDFWIPDEWNQGLTYELFPQHNIVIPSGVKIEVPFGYGLFVLNKSGVASKKQMLKGAELIDHGYSGEVHFDMHNTGNQIQELVPGQKIVQAVLLKIEVPELLEVDETELYKDVLLVSSRGAGGFGSTDEQKSPSSKKKSK